MKRFIKYLFLAVIFSIPLQGMGQQKGASIAFQKKGHDFGNIKEEAGIVTYNFGFTNTGNEPLIIKRVTASCGCTSPSWTKQPVPPGAKGNIKVAFNPRNRVNKFNKSVSVYSNASQSVVNLRIYGNIIPKPRTIEDDYPYQIGPVRFKTNHMAFARVYKHKKKTTRIAIINTSDQNQTITFSQVPAQLKLQAVPATLKPKEKGVIEGVYDPDQVNDWGFIISRAVVVFNNDENRNNRLTISATISEDFSKFTPEQLAKAPVISFKEKSFDFGTMKQRSTVEHEFVFTNKGKSNLEIRKVRSSCGCTVVAPKEKVILPGKSSSIKAVFSSGTRVGRQNKSITIISNDAKNSTVVVRLSGIVEAPKAK